MRHRLDENQVNSLKEAIKDLLDAGWDSRLDLLWDLREKIPQLERLSNNTADQHLFRFHQSRESPTLINYLLIAMQSLLNEIEDRNKQGNG